MALAGLTSTASRATPGTSSRKNASRFAPSSALTKLAPVRLPPGRARLATSPSLDRVFADNEDDWDRLGCRLGRERAARGRRESRLPSADQFDRQRWQPVELTLGPAVFNRHVLALDITGFF